MKWLMEWITEDEDDCTRENHKSWATSWQEVMGYFMTWITQDSDTIEGQVTAYKDGKPYGDGDPCLYFSAYPF